MTPTIPTRRTLLSPARITLATVALSALGWLVLLGAAAPALCVG